MLPADDEAPRKLRWLESGALIAPTIHNAWSTLVLVEIQIVDEKQTVVLTLDWRRRSKEVCYPFVDSRIARASFKKIGRELGVDEEAWTALGI